MHIVYTKDSRSFVGVKFSCVLESVCSIATKFIGGKMSRICALPLMLRQYTLKNARISSIGRNFTYSSSLSAQNLTSNYQNEFHNPKTIGVISTRDYYRRPIVNRNFSWRNYSSQKPSSNSSSNPASAGGSDDGHVYDSDGFEVYSEDEVDEEVAENMQKSVPSTSTVPDFFPKVPLIATSFPVFPKFMKVFEITDPKLIKLLEWKLSMRQPYAGIFVRKTPDSTTNLCEVKDLNECHPIGTFVKITEIHRTEEKLQFVATAHRRIQIEKQLKHERVAKPSVDKKSRKQLQEIQNILRDPECNILMVQVKNVEEEQPDLNSVEYKAITMEIVKTIRDIIMSNSLIRENLQQLLGNNLRVNDNPSYLADMAASITSSKPDELQEIMNEKNVFNRMKMALNLLMKEKQLLELQQKIGQEVETKIREQHRTFMLREQLKAIKRELGLEKDDKDALAEKYKKLLEGKVVPEAIKTVLDEELQKLSFLDNNSTEFT